MPSYKLTYFNSRGRAEAMRIIFEVAGVKYEDVRIEPAKWPELKPKTPFGQLPILEIDGKVVTQSKAISRYLARELGLYGSSLWEALEIDVVLEICDDLLMPMIAVFGEKDEEKKKELIKKFYDENVPKFSANLEKVLCQNKEGSGFFVGDKISLADIGFLTSMDWIINPEHPDVLEPFPKLKAVFSRIKSNEKIAAWFEKRPQTQS